MSSSEATDMVERVARAIHEADRETGVRLQAWSRMDAHDRAGAMKAARAAIAAIRPANNVETLDLIGDERALGLVMRLTGGSVNPGVVTAQIERLRADSMVDFALSEPATPGE